MANEGKYLYAIVRESRPREFGRIGIGERNDEVYTVRYKDLTCVVSNSPLKKYPVSREYCLAHQKVLEKVMEEYTILPVRYGVIAENLDLVREKLLMDSYDILQEQLDRIWGEIELGLKVMWRDMPTIYQELVEGNDELRKLRDALKTRATHDEKIHLGKMVEQALNVQKEKERKTLLSPLKRLSSDSKDNFLMGEWMVVNSAFLVDGAKVKEFDQNVSELSEKYNERMKCKYFGPVPPYNFVYVPVDIFESDYSLKAAAP